jgi:hypothetical protein
MSEIDFDPTVFSLFRSKKLCLLANEEDICHLQAVCVRLRVRHVRGGDPPGCSSR